MKRLSRWQTGHRVLLRTLGFALFLPMLLASSASANDQKCAWPTKPLSEFDVAGTEALVGRIPGLRAAPELNGYPVLVNGEPELQGGLHVTVYACSPWGLIPTTGGPPGPPGPDAPPRPSFLRNVVIIQTETEALWYDEVNLQGFVP